MPTYYVLRECPINGIKRSVGERVELNEKRGNWLISQGYVGTSPGAKAVQPQKPRKCCGW